MFNRIQCAAGQVVNIIDAAYGRNDGTTCPHSAVSNQNCKAHDSLQKVQDEYVEIKFPYIQLPI